MKNLRYLHDNREEGFTLIEMMATVCIIGILAAISIPIYLNNKKTSVDNNVRTDLKSAAMVVENWSVSHPRGIPKQNVIDNVNITKGTTLTLTSADPGKYVIVGKNPKGKEAATTAGIIYDSTLEGPNS
ncbi:MAG: prepilin-type N-terminal cleavage/methylation domain-containing protein [Enterococcus sp.]|nr:prepilin-type N-terminal cleavage/methylation domain-containing protein [Enterococcus sp.]